MLLFRIKEALIQFTLIHFQSKLQQMKTSLILNDCLHLG